MKSHNEILGPGILGPRILGRILGPRITYFPQSKHYYYYYLLILGAAFAGEQWVDWWGGRRY